MEIISHTRILRIFILIDNFAFLLPFVNNVIVSVSVILTEVQLSQKRKNI